MANRRLPVRKTKEILRLKYACGLSAREIARSCNVARSTVADYLRRAMAAGVNWPEVADLTEAQLEQRLFPTEHLPSSVHRPPPDCEHIYNQLRCYRNINLTLTQLWLEYKAEHPDGYQYTQFCEYYRRWRGKLDYCMRQEHRAGEKVFVDYSDGLSITDPATGELIPTQLFTLRRACLRHCRTGLAPMCVPSGISAACPGCWSRIISKVGYTPRAYMSRS